jgi:hypothetical protein
MGCPANGKSGFGMLNDNGRNRVPLVGPPTIITATTLSSAIPIFIFSGSIKIHNEEEESGLEMTMRLNVDDDNDNDIVK